MKKKMLHIDIRKLFFGISLIPYIVFLVLGIVNTIKISIENRRFELYELISPISDLWFDFIIELNLIYIILFIFFIGYPIYYLIDKSNKAKRELVFNQNKKIDKLYMLYLFSFLPYLFLIYSCIFGIKFIWFFSVSIYYGFEAIFVSLLYGIIIPVYPIILIFQVIYTMKKYKMFNQKRKRDIKIMITSLISLLIFPAFIYLILI